MEPTHVTHEIEPVYSISSKVLLLGTMPSPRSREEGFFYGHPRNRFWKVLAALFDEPEPETIEEKRDLCLRHDLALWDVLASCDIKGASDASIRNARPNDLSRILDAAPIQAIFTTGTKAGSLYRRLCETSTNVPCTVLPSTSPANSRVRLGELIKTYRNALAPYLEFTPERPVFDVEKVVSLEHAIANSGTSLFTLMHRAGRFLAFETRKHLAGCEPEQTTIAVLCGKGNNGGDGWVAAKYLAHDGFKVKLISPIPAAEIKAEPAHATACQIEEELRSCKNTVIMVSPEKEELRGALMGSQCIIDAILGTGFSGDSVREPFATWIELANEARSRAQAPCEEEQGSSSRKSTPSPIIIAADVASGFSAQTGNIAQPCMKADHTVTMIVLKTGLATPQAKAQCGTIRVAPLADISDLI